MPKVTSGGNAGSSVSTSVLPYINAASNPTAVLDPTGVTDGSINLSTLMTIAAAASVANNGLPCEIYLPPGQFIFGTNGPGSFQAAASPTQSTGLIIIQGSGQGVTFLRPSRMNCKGIAITMPCEVRDVTVSDQLPLGTLTSLLSTGGPITSIPVTATQNAIANGAIFMINSPGGVNNQNWTTTANVPVGSTSIPVASQTPNFAYTVGSPVAIWSITTLGMSTNLINSTGSGAHQLQSFAGSALIGIPSNAVQPSVGNSFTMGGAGWQGGLGAINAFPLCGTVSALPATGMIIGTTGVVTSGTFQLTWTGQNMTVLWNSTAAQLQTLFQALTGGSGITVTALPTPSAFVNPTAQLPTPTTGIQNSSNNGGLYIQGVAAGSVTVTGNSLGGTSTPTPVAYNILTSSVMAGCNTANNITFGTGSVLPNGQVSSIPISLFAVRRCTFRDAQPGGGGYVLDITDGSQPCGGYNTNTGQALVLNGTGLGGTFTITDTVQNKTTAGIGPTATAGQVSTALTTAGISGITCFGGPLPGATLNGSLPTAVYFSGVAALELTVNTTNLTGTGAGATIYQPFRGEIGLMSDPVNSFFAIQGVIYQDCTIGPSNNNHNNVTECGGIQTMWCNNLHITGLGAPPGAPANNGSRVAINNYGTDRVMYDGIQYDYTGSGNATYIITLDFTTGCAGEATISNMMGYDVSQNTQPAMTMSAPYLTMVNVHMAPISTVAGGELQIAGGTQNLPYDSLYCQVKISDSNIGNGIDLNNAPVGRLQITNSELGPTVLGANGGCIRNVHGAAVASGPIYTHNVTWNTAAGGLATNCGLLVGTNAQQIWQIHSKGDSISKTVGGLILFSGTFANSGLINNYAKFDDLDGFSGQFLAGGSTINGQTLPAAPVSGTTYGPYLCDVWLTAICTTSLAAGTVTLATAPGPANSSFTNVATSTPTVTADVDTIHYRLPANTAYKFTYSSDTPALSGTN